MEVVLADLASPELTRAVLRARADDADALLDDWASRLRPLHDEPAGWSTLVAARCSLAQVSAISKPHFATAAEGQPELTKETFMTAAQERFLEGKEEGLEEGERAALSSTLSKLARLRFRDVPPDRAARIEAASKADLERWLERILTAETLDDLFA